MRKPSLQSIAATLLFVTLPCVAFAEVRLPTPLSLGLRMESSFSSQSGQRLLTVRYIDASSGTSMTATYSSLGDLIQLEERAPSGRILERQEFYPGNKVVHETFDSAGHVLMTTRPLSQSTLTYEKLTWPPGSSTPIIEKGVLPSSQSDCPGLEPPPNADALIKDVSWINARAGKPNGTDVPLGHGIVARNCQAFPEGGVDGVSRAITEGLKEGLACLAELSPKRRMDAAKMLALLGQGPGAKPLLIQCTDPYEVGDPVDHEPGPARYVGKAAMCPSPAFPRVTLHSANNKGAPPEAIQATILHEMMHLIGYKHAQGADMPYLAEICCIKGYKSTYIQSSACKIIKTEENWTTWKYANQFSEIMMQVKYQDELVINSVAAFVRTSADGGKGPNRDATPLFSVAMNMATIGAKAPAVRRNDGSAMTALVLGRAALEHMTPDQRANHQPGYEASISNWLFPKSDPFLIERREFAELFGMILGEASKLKDNTERLNSVLPVLAAKRKTACAKLNPSERLMINNIGRKSKNQLDPDRLQGEAREMALAWGNICPN